MKALVLWSACLLAAVAPVSAQRGGGAPAPKPVKYLTAQQLSALDAHIEQVRAQWEIPGLAVAIVQGDSVLLTKGYGVKELGKPDRVDANTLFAIGSSGKSMTAAIVSMLVDEGKMRLDEPVQTYLPRFRVADAYVSREATMRDLLSHRTSLENADVVWYGSELNRAQVIDRLRHLKLSSSFRSRFQYNNLMLMVAGEAAAAAAGSTWEDLLRSRLLQPLGMTASLPHSEAAVSASNVATPHMTLKGKLMPIPHRKTAVIAPAGGQYSSARDMAQYLRFQLGNGTYGGKRLVSEGSMTQMRSLVSTNGAPVYITDSTTTAIGYGLGWFVEYYRGHRLMRHGGAIDGMLTEMMFLPEDQVGIVILTNRSPHTMHTALTHHIFDVALGLPQRDWNGQAYTRTKAQETQAAERLKTLETQKASGPAPAPPFDRYAQTYSDSLIGSVVVTAEGNGLTLRFHPGFVGTLTPWQFNSFRLEWQNATVLGAGGGFATFTLDQTGRATEVRVDGIGTFRAAAQGGRGGRGGGTPQ